jgi:hypothetical protein
VEAWDRCATPRALQGLRFDDLRHTVITELARWVPPETGNRKGADPEGGDNTEIEALIQVSDSVTSQFAFAGLAAFR